MELEPAHGHKMRTPSVKFLKCWSKVVDRFHRLSLKMESTTWPAIEVFGKSYDDWNKVLAFIKSQQHVYKLGRGHPYQKYVESLEVPW